MSGVGAAVAPLPNALRQAVEQLAELHQVRVYVTLSYNPKPSEVGCLTS